MQICRNLTARRVAAAVSPKRMKTVKLFIGHAPTAGSQAKPTGDKNARRDTITTAVTLFGVETTRTTSTVTTQAQKWTKMNVFASYAKKPGKLEKQSNNVRFYHMN